MTTPAPTAAEADEDASEALVEVALETYPDQAVTVLEREDVPEGLRSDLADWFHAPEYVFIPPGKAIELIVHLPDGTTVLCISPS